MQNNIDAIKLIIILLVRFADIDKRMNRASCKDQTNRVSISASRFYRTPNLFLLVAPSRLLSHEWDSFRFFLPFASASYRYRGLAKAT